SHSRRRRPEVSVEISVRGTGREPAPRALGSWRRPGAALRAWNSWRVFHAWQCGHWPAQRRVSPPHSVQTKVTVERGIVPACRPRLVFTSAPVAFYGAERFFRCRKARCARRILPGFSAALTTPGAAFLFSGRPAK